MKRVLGVLLAMLVVGGVALGQPTSVASVTPSNGAIGVDPGLDEIRVTFSRAMRQGGMSLVGGGELFPEILGRPYWISTRTLVIPVRLEPNREYRLSINDERHDNFRDVRGHPIAPYPVRFITGGTEEVLAGDRWDGVIDRAAELLGSSYAYRDRLGLDWGEVVDRYRAVLAGCDSPASFAHAFGVVLAVAQDRHMWLEAEGKTYGTCLRSPTPNVEPRAVEMLVEDYQTLGPSVATGRLSGGIGYIAVDSWDASNRDGVRRAIEALRSMDGLSGLVIDVRLNGGGDEALAQELAGCFVDEPVVYAKHVPIDPDSPDGFGAVRTRTLAPNTGGVVFDGPIAVLTGAACMSSNEAFVLMMRAAGATIVGGRTLGSSGNPKPYDLGGGVTLHLPSWRAMTADGVEFEGVGLEPDVPVEFDWRGASVLERAIEVLRGGS